MQYLPLAAKAMSWIPTAARIVSRFARAGRQADRLLSHVGGVGESVRKTVTPFSDILDRYYRVRRQAAALSRARAYPLQTNVAGGMVLQRAPRTAAAAHAHATYRNTRPLAARLRQRNLYLRAIQRLRRRRQVRAHYANPRTKHRLLNKVASRGVRVEARARRFKRRVKLRRRLRGKVRRWYKLGKWNLTNDYINTIPVPSSNEIFERSYLSQLSLAYIVENGNLTLSSGGMRFPLGVAQVVGPTAVGGVNTFRMMFGAPIHFNVQTTSANNYINNSLPTMPTNNLPGSNYGDSTANELANVAFMTNYFCYEASNAQGYSLSTPYARMPPVPISTFKFTSDSSNPQSLNDVVSSMYMLPYHCYWKKVYFRVNYAIKVSWPSAWGQLSGSTVGSIFRPGPGSVLPANPVLYVRLFAVRILSSNRITGSDFCKFVFPNNSPINTGFVKGYRKNLWTVKAVLVWHRLWMFNGQITPQFQAQENLTDGEEGHFNLGINYKTQNLAGYPVSIADEGNETATCCYWPTTLRQGGIQFFAFAGFRGSLTMIDFTQLNNENATAAESRVNATLGPSFSASFNFTAYCYPMLRQQKPLLPRDFYNAVRSPSNVILTEGYEKWKNMSENEVVNLETALKVEEKTDEQIEKEATEEEEPTLVEDLEVSSGSLHSGSDQLPAA